VQLLAGDKPRFAPGGQARRVIAMGFVLVPVMFMMIVIGALLSSRAHSTGTCEAGYAAGIGSPWVSPRCARWREAGRL
jgi:hypothetical protein